MEIYAMEYQLSALLEQLVKDCASSSAERGTRGRTAIIGSGPAGLAAAVELATLGYAVDVFEAAPASGITLLRKPALESSSAAPDALEPVSEEQLTRATSRLAECGIAFYPSAPRGQAELTDMLKNYDAVICACGKAAVLPTDSRGCVNGNLFAAGTCVKNQKVQSATQAAASGKACARSLHEWLIQR